MESIRWPPKVRQAKIWQLYQNDALGAVDEDLVEDVGYALYQRCHAIRLVTNCKVECPRCGAEFAVGDPNPWRMLPGALTCPTPGCGWQTTAEDWHASWRHRDLLGTAVRQIFETYLHDYPRAKTVEERTVCIDQLIHGFHLSLLDGKPGRSFANNLIEGSHKQVIDLLDRLSVLPGGVDKDNWRGNLRMMWQKRRGLSDG